MSALARGNGVSLTGIYRGHTTIFTSSFWINDSSAWMTFLGEFQYKIKKNGCKMISSKLSSTIHSLKSSYCTDGWILERFCYVKSDGYTFLTPGSLVNFMGMLMPATVLIVAVRSNWTIGGSRSPKKMSCSSGRILNRRHAPNFTLSTCTIMPVPFELPEDEEDESSFKPASELLRTSATIGTFTLPVFLKAELDMTSRTATFKSSESNS